MNKPNPIRSLGRSLLASVGLQTNSPAQTCRFGQRLVSSVRALLTVSVLAALAVSSRSLALTLPPPLDLGPAGVSAVAQGYVAGSSNTRAFVWSAASGMTDLGALLPGSPYSAATGVNSHGEVVGGYYAPEYSSVTAFYRSPATGVVIIGPTSNFSQWPLFINESGVVAGLDAQGNAFRWTRTGGVQSLGVAGAVAGINARGDIAINAGSRAFIVWGDGSPMTTLNSPGLSSPPPISIQNQGEVNIQVNGINDSGVVVGTYWDYRYMYDGYDISQGGFFTAVVHNSHAFKWTSAGGLTDLGNFGTWPLIGKPYPTYSNFAAVATAINNEGTIVGYSYRSAGNNYVPFVYKNGTMSQLPKLNPGDDYALASAINDDGVVAGYSGGNQASVLWQNGVPTNVTPSFAGPFTGSPFIKGSTVAGNGQHAWTFALPSAPPPPPPLPTQTLSILGGVGNPGDIAANTEYFNPATQQWQPAYLVNYAPYGHPVTHPWGNVAGTTRWINYKTDGASDPGAGPTIANTLWYSYRVRFTVPSDAQNPKMTFSLKADNLAQVAINGVSTGPTIQGQADQLNADAVFSQAVHPGENTITLNVGDYGGLNGFNFRIDLSMQASQPLEIVPVAPADTTPPVITAPASITIEATGPNGAVVNFTATAQDNVSGPVTVTASRPSGSTFPLGTTTVSLTATDAAGNNASASFTITVRDTTAPAISAPATASAEATSAAGAVVTFVATANDAVSGNVPVTANPPSGSTVAIGFSSVTLSATDAAGNTASKSILINVRDTTAPALTLPANQTIEATSAAGAVATFAASATDAVGVTSFTSSAASGSTFPIGTTTVTVTAKDAANNTSSGSFSVTVRDTTAPALTLPANQTIEATSAAGAIATFAATATDSVGVTSLTYSAASGSTFALGITTVNVTATDAAGNSSSGSFTITVRDTTAPVISSLTASSTSLWPPNHKMVPITLSASASDAVGVSSLKIVSATSNEPDNGLGDGDTAGDIEITGALTLNLRAERSGTGDGRVYTIKVEAKDAAGNATTKTVTVSVPKSQGGK